MTRTDCQRADAAAAGQQAATLRARYPSDVATIDGAVVEWLAQCVIKLGEVDQDRAMSLHQQALAAFGPVPRLAQLKLDPCAMRYLVGKGTAAGRSGFCADDLGGGLTGPRLVVVPDGDGRFAISKFEISEADLAPFCAETGRCTEPSNSNQPGTGVGLELASAYADWLTQRSGHRYRLPTRAEWEHVARAGKPDPNRNCQVRVAGVSRGKQAVPVTSGAQNELGLVNLFGNVRELAMDEDRPVALGGSYADPISACDIGAVNSVSSAGDPSTGMRLVREVP